MHSQPPPRSHGTVVLDKPGGMTSAAALRGLKERVGKKTKVGHAGTLDPFATGVLLALVGDGTRLSDLAMSLPKTYRATVQFGVSTDTLDGTGTPVGDAVDVSGGPPDGWLDAVAAFEGAVSQVPPAYSALKVDGKRAYSLARRGVEVSLEPRSVVCHEIEVESATWPTAVVRLTTGRGYYVRCFARDWGEAIGVPAHLTALRRTRIGPFEAADGVDPRDAGPDHCVAPRVLAQAAALDAVTLSREDASMFVAGRVVRMEQPRRGVAAVYWQSRLLGLGRCRDDELRAQAVLSASRQDLEG